MKWKVWLLRSLAVVVGLVIILLSYVMLALPDAGPAPDLKVERTAARIARGAYLANHVAVCMDCHSKRDMTEYAGPVIPGTLGQGGEVFDQTLGFPGRFVASNITPTGIGTYTDGELFRAITTGMKKDGGVIFPVMPWEHYAKMDVEDIYSIIAYLRTLAPLPNKPEASKPDFPMNIIMRTMPKKGTPRPIPVMSNQVAYGKYLFNTAACGFCHTKQEQGQPVKGMEMAGGFEFPMPNGITVRSANITPDEQTGIGAWTETAFVNRFKAYRDSAFLAQKHPVTEGSMNSVMPWRYYAGMKEDDLKAIFAYLRTVPKINHTVEKMTSLTASGS